MADREYGPEPLSLMRDMQADAAWLDHVTSLEIEVESTWKTSPEEIARQVAQHKSEWPEVGWTPEKIPGLRPTFFERSHFAFDAKRICLRQSRGAGEVDITAWDGTRAIRGTHREQLDAYQVDTKLCPLLDHVLSDVPWFGHTGHQFWFVPEEQRALDLSDRAEDYQLLGRTPFHGVDCYEICGHPLRTLWFIGVADRRLYGSRSYVVARAAQAQFMDIWQAFARREGWPVPFMQFGEWIRAQPRELRDRTLRDLSAALAPIMVPHIEHWFGNYVDVGQGRHAPMTMGYAIFDAASAGNVMCSRDIRVLRFEVDHPLADSLLKVELKEGGDVTDLGHDPPLHYRHKPDRTTAEWQQIRGEADDRRSRAQAAARRRDLLIGKPAPDLPPAEWLASGPLSWADMKGKIVLLDFFTDCSCNEFSTLSLINRDSSQGRIVVIAVPMGFRSLETVRNRAREHQLDCPVCLVQGRDSGELFGRYHLDRIPYAFVIGRDGEVAGHGTLSEAIHRAAALA